MKKIIFAASLLALGACTNTTVKYEYDAQGRIVEATCSKPKLFGLIGGVMGSCDIMATAVVTTEAKK